MRQEAKVAVTSIAQPHKAQRKIFFVCDIIAQCYGKMDFNLKKGLRQGSGKTGKPFRYYNGCDGYSGVCLQNKFRIASACRFQLRRLFLWGKRCKHFVVPGHSLLKGHPGTMRRHPAPIGKFQAGCVAENAVIHRRRPVVIFHKFPRFHA